MDSPGVTIQHEIVSLTKTDNRIEVSRNNDTAIQTVEKGRIILTERIVSGANRFEKDFTYEDAADGFLAIGNIPADKRVYNTVLIIQTAFDDLTVTIGDDDAQARLLTITENNPAIENIYSAENHTEYSALTLLKLYFSGAPAVGEGTAIIYYS